jgi:hypothetical protein
MEMTMVPNQYWAVQFSINDGTNTGRVSYVTGLNSPHGTLWMLWFSLASQNMVNALKQMLMDGPLFDTLMILIF